MAFYAIDTHKIFFCKFLEVMRAIVFYPYPVKEIKFIIYKNNKNINIKNSLMLVHTLSYDFF